MVLRLAQGFGAGAEIAGSSVMLIEYAPRRNRGLVGLLVAWAPTRTLGASAIWGVLVATLSTQAVIEWAGVFRSSRRR
ncbi:MAG: hypothetical protein R2742_00780 [Micropruina glycogenica]